MKNLANPHFERIFAYNGLDNVDLERKQLFYEKYENFKDNIPVDVIRLAKELGLNLFTSEDFNNKQSGKIEYDVIAKSYKIYVNVKHSLNRNLFTIAHEIGHFICDKDYLEKNEFILEDEDIVNSLNRSTVKKNHDRDVIKRDIRANKFAAELLMPTDKFIEVWSNRYSLEEVAKKFMVSPEAVKIRAYNLLGVICE